MKGAAEFFLDTLVEEPSHHWLVTCPSLSPENRHPKGHEHMRRANHGLWKSCATCSRTLIRAGEIPERRCGVSQPGCRRARPAPPTSRLARRANFKNGCKIGTSLAPELHHRHVSHLYGLFPSSQITRRGTPDLAAAAHESLSLRGDKATGWATAWRINLWARLHEGDHAYEILKIPVEPATHVPGPVRRPSAVPDRRQLRRHVRHRGDVAAK